MDGRRWRRFFLTWPEPVASRRRNAPRRRLPQRLPPPHRRDGAALLVSLALVLAARRRPDLLAGRADADVGIPAALSRRPAEPRGAGGRRIHRRGAAVGHPVPRPDR